MGNTKVNLDIKDLIPGIIEEDIAPELFSAMYDGTLNALSKGSSPVRSESRFEAYKSVAKKNAIKQGGKPVRQTPGSSSSSHGYPYSVMGKYPNKKVRPVNLKLSGDLYDSFDYKLSKDNQITFGIFSSSAKGDVAKYAAVHNDGLRADIPERHFLPTRQGDEFQVSIMRNILKIIEEKLSKLIKKSNSR